VNSRQLQMKAKDQIRTGSLLIGVSSIAMPELEKKP
jgi:hypothetical protein